MKMRIKVETTLEFTTARDDVPESVMREMAIGFETGYRMAGLKDISLVQAIFKEQFGQGLTVGDPKYFFDISIEK